MPLLILVVVVALVLGLTVRPAGIAYVITSVLGLLGIVQMVWAVTDGKGNDPWWLIIIGILAAGIAVALAAAGRRMRGWPVTAG